MNSDQKFLDKCNFTESPFLQKVGVGAWKPMYNDNNATDGSAISTAEDEAQGCFRTLEAFNGTSLELNEDIQSEVVAKYQKPVDTMLLKSGSESNVCYSNVLSNDAVIIVEVAKTAPLAIKDLHSSQDSAVMNYRRQVEVYGHRGIQSNRAGPTIRSLSEAELPQPDTVRRAKDMFETLAKRQKDEITLRHQHSFSSDTVKPTNTKSGIGRSQSMLVLTGRAWCNGGTTMANNNGRHRNGACSDALTAGRSAYFLDVDTFNGNLAKFKTMPAQQRSCSELDKYFQNDHGKPHDKGKSGDLWEHTTDNDRGSPVSPEVIQKIRERGTCVQFFGSEASVVGSTEDEFDDDSVYDGSDGYLLEYPYDLYHSANSYSPITVEDGVAHKPKVIGMVPKSLSDASSSSSRSSAMPDSETSSSPSPSSHNGWIIGGSYINGVSLEDIQASLNGSGMDTSRPGSSLESGYVKLKHYYEKPPMNGYQVPTTISRCHGKWMKNPYWQGSYYVVYDFTLKDSADASPKCNGV